MIENLGNLAVLVVDIQNDFCHLDGKFAQASLDLTAIQAMVPRLKTFIDEVRPYDVPIIYTRQIESVQVSPANLQRQFATSRMFPVCAPDSWGSELYELQPQQNEHVLDKYTYDPFSNPELERVLQEKNVKTLIVAGVNTPLCIDTTVRSGFSRGYNILVPRDLVAMSASLPGNQQASLELFHRFFGTVTDARTIVDYLKKNK